MQSREELLGQGGARQLPDVEDVGDLSIHRCSLRQSRKVDEEYAVGRLANGSARGFEGQPRLPDAAHAAERHEAARLQKPIDVGELALAADEAGDRGGKIVAFLRRSGRRDLMTQDRLLEALQLLAGLEAELLVEDPACASVRGERIGLAFRPIQGEHQLPPQPFAVRVLADQAFQLIDQRGILAERKVGLNSILERRQPKILQTLGLQSQGPFVAHPCEGMAPPELQGLAQARRRSTTRSAFERLVSLSREPFETVRVHAVVPDVERVARGAARDRGIGTQHGAELGDVGADRRQGAFGRLSMPELVGEPIERNRPRSTDEQECEQHALARPPERNRDSIPDDLDGAEHPKLDHAGDRLALAPVFTRRW